MKRVMPFGQTRVPNPPPWSFGGALRRRLRCFVALGPADRWLILKLWPLLGIVSLLVQGLGYQRTQRLLARVHTGDRAAFLCRDGAMDYARRVGRLTRVAGRHIPTDGSCLRQSLLVWWVLRCRGLAAELKIGVRTTEGFAAHAWVELDGQPVNDTADVAKRFAALHGVVA
jgi:hypothetical protein